MSIFPSIKEISNCTGKQVSVTGINLFRLAAGKIAEIWLNVYDLGELQQLGAFPR